MTITASGEDGGLHRQRKLGRVLLYAVLIGGAALMLYPLMWMIISSFKADQEIFSDSAALPSSWNPINYIQGWVATTPSFTRYFINSFIVCAGAVVGNVLVYRDRHHLTNAYTRTLEPYLEQRLLATDALGPSAR